MGTVVSVALGHAAGVALSPVPVIAIILILFSPRARVTGPVFLLGWVVTLAVGCTAAYLLALAGHADTDDATADGIAWGRLLVGLFFLVLAARKWRDRPTEDDPPQLPAWTEAVGDFGAGKTLGLAAALAGANPKNLVLLLSVGSGIAEAGPATQDAITAIVVFTIVGSVTVAVPLCFQLLAPRRAASVLDSAKGWLAVHNTSVMVGVLVVLGVALVAGALSALGS